MLAIGGVILMLCRSLLLSSLGCKGWRMGWGLCLILGIGRILVLFLKLQVSLSIIKVLLSYQRGFPSPE
jgi:hypothetical protein